MQYLASFDMYPDTVMGTILACADTDSAAGNLAEGCLCMHKHNNFQAWISQNIFRSITLINNQISAGNSRPVLPQVLVAESLTNRDCKTAMGTILTCVDNNAAAFLSS